MGRAKHAHWALAPAAAAAAGLDVITVTKAQQWETPWEVYNYVRERWTVQFDACASPLNALVTAVGLSGDQKTRCLFWGVCSCRRKRYAASPAACCMPDGAT